jgi:four helix bundle protein
MQIAERRLNHDDINWVLGLALNKDELKARTKQFALDVMRQVESLPKAKTADILGRQLMRSGTSVGANYRSACRAKSTADFIAKLGIVEEEADETLFWLELLIESKLIQKENVESLMKEANEILAITVSSIKTAKLRRK